MGGPCSNSAESSYSIAVEMPGKRVEDEMMNRWRTLISCKARVTLYGKDLAGCCVLNSFLNF
jgi:hypothetical protein